MKERQGDYSLKLRLAFVGPEGVRSIHSIVMEFNMTFGFGNLEIIIP